MTGGGSGRRRVGIVGASGYMGGEALRVVLEHPGLEVAFATSRTPGPVEVLHPNLLGLGLETVRIEEAGPADAVLLALPTAAAVEAASRFMRAGARVVDLGAAFRLEDRTTWERVYGEPHAAWSLAEAAVYGVPELHETAIRQAKLVANPGCFSSAAILALAPLVAEGLVDTARLVVNGISGTTGMGAEPCRGGHHPEIGNNLLAYRAVDHRHSYEIEQELGRLAGGPVQVHFTPVYAPVVRGILGVCHTFPTRGVSRAEILALMRDFYAGQPFVKVHDLPQDPGDPWGVMPYPWVSAVAGTNYAFVGVDVDERRGRIVTLCVLDSIGKGGAQVGVENLNLMLGLPRSQGLERRGLHPA